MSQVHAATHPGTLGEYVLSERLGFGGQGEVWRAYDRVRGVEVALKILASERAVSAAGWAALERMHALVGGLQHPGILQVLPPQRLEGRVVLPMELVEGGDLTELRGKGYLRIVPVLVQVAVALHYAHQHGVVHRDLKPTNVLLDRRGRVKLADFGIAAALSDRQAGSGASEVSPFSASPEQLRGEPAHPADDIYGLGTLAYDLLTGHPPYFPHFDAARIQSGPVPQLVPLQPAPSRLIDLILRMLAPRAADRPPSMQKVIDELEATLNATSALDSKEDLARPLAERAPVERPIDAASEPPLAARPKPPLAAETEPPLTPRPEPLLAAEPEAFSADEGLSMTIGDFRPGRGQRASRRGDPPRVHRLPYLLLGLVCGAVLAVGALQGLSHQGWRGSPFHVLSALILGARTGPPVDPAHPGHSVPAAPRSAAPSADWAALGRLVAQRAGFNQRLSDLAARGASIWDAADFVAAQAQAADTSRAEAAGDIAATRRHWQLAQRLLARLEREAPRALAAQLAVGERALAAGQPGAAERAFALARRIQPASRRAAAGERQVRLLAAVLPLMGSARRAERAHDYARAAAAIRAALARDPTYAPARAALAHLNTVFARAGYVRAVRAGAAAYARGRLFQAQADFQQALVFRPDGIAANRGLAEVDAELRDRAALP